jgi:hypothetical protein
MRSPKSPKNRTVTRKQKPRPTPALSPAELKCCRCVLYGIQRELVGEEREISWTEQFLEKLRGLCFWRRPSFHPAGSPGHRFITAARTLKRQKERKYCTIVLRGKDINPRLVFALKTLARRLEVPFYHLVLFCLFQGIRTWLDEGGVGNINTLTDEALQTFIAGQRRVVNLHMSALPTADEIDFPAPDSRDGLVKKR